MTITYALIELVNHVAWQWKTTTIRATLGVSPFSTTGPNEDDNEKKDGLLKKKRESREAKFDDDNESFLRLTVRPSGHYQQLAEEKESTSPINYLKRQKVVLPDHENTELKKKSGLVMECDDDNSIISLNLGVLPVSTTRPSTDDDHEKENKDHQQLKKKKRRSSTMRAFPR